MGIVAVPGAETVVATWAVWKANAVAALIHPLFQNGAVATALRDCGAKVVVVDGHTFAPHLISLLLDEPQLRTVILTGRSKPLSSLPSALTLSWEDAVAPARGDHPPERHAIDADLAVILYELGGDGGVMLTHRAVLASAAALSVCLGLDEDDVILEVPSRPLHRTLHDMVASMGVGGRLVLSASLSHQSHILRTMLDERVTGLPGTSSVYEALEALRDRDAFDLSRLRFVCDTGAGMTRERIALLDRLFPQASLFSMFGWDECSCCTVLPSEDVHRIPGSIGAAVPNTEVWLAGPDGSKLGSGGTGELVVRGVGTMSGYWNKPDLSASRLELIPPVGDRGLHSRRWFTMDDNGHLFFVRASDKT